MWKVTRQISSTSANTMTMTWWFNSPKRNAISVTPYFYKKMYVKISYKTFFRVYVSYSSYVISRLLGSSLKVLRISLTVVASG
jgi:hypothetical protein